MAAFICGLWITWRDSSHSLCHCKAELTDMYVCKRKFICFIIEVLFLKSYKSKFHEVLKGKQAWENLLVRIRTEMDNLLNFLSLVKWEAVGLNLSNGSQKLLQ